jgi:Chitinase class I
MRRIVSAANGGTGLAPRRVWLQDQSHLNTSTSKDTTSSDAANKAAAQAPAPVVSAGTTEADAQKATAAAASQTANTLTAAIPPVVPKEIPKSTAVSNAAPSALPLDGYAFLRLLTNDDWNWMFPLRSGRYVANGGSRNADGFARQDGSTDSFSLDAFIRAVLEYNNWAKVNGYKQFLNQGTLKQQAEEFLVFWAKSSRETSGSWSTAPSPWIETETFAGETMKVWKGGLYWVEEVGYTTNSATGKSTAIGYVDTGSSEFPPSVGRSYYGRGVIQLSWNYNYGAFSYWMFDNGLFRAAKDAAGICKIDYRNQLLDFPNLVADCGDLSILSGIWFWMPPQGAKPSSHDVIFGEVTNISKSTQDNGLPQTNNGYVRKVSIGETSDSEVFAYRLGSVINIVNGGLECNKSSAWHGGPLQRVSYYNAYAAKFNEKYKVNATRVTAATNVWTDKVSDSSSVALQSATCYNQKSYYGW